MPIHELIADLRDQWIYAAITFIALLVLFHIYVYVAKPSARFLKKTEYLWLGLGALSIITAVGDTRRLVAENSLETASNQFVNAGDPVVGLIQRTATFFVIC
jgi:hypothetical protein